MIHDPLPVTIVPYCRVSDPRSEAPERWTTHRSIIAHRMRMDCIQAKVLHLAVKKLHDELKVTAMSNTDAPLC